MTRDKAIQIELEEVYGIFDQSHPRYGECRTTAGRHIDRYVHLGMLKLDEPELLEQRINYALNAELTYGAHKCAKDIKGALDRAGLKIVEK